MHFKITEQVTPISGQTKAIAKFAWLPKKIGGALVWLEQYEILYIYRITELPFFSDDKQAIYKHGEWVQVESKLIKWVHK